MKPASPVTITRRSPLRLPVPLVRFPSRPRTTGGIRTPCTDGTPSLSAYVPEPVTPAKIPFAWLPQNHREGDEGRRGVSEQPTFMGFGPPNPKDRARFQAQRQLDENLNLSELWRVMTTEITGEDPPWYPPWRPIFLSKLKDRRALMDPFSPPTISKIGRRPPKTIQDFGINWPRPSNPA